MTLRARRKNDTQGEVGGFLRQRGFEFEFFAAGLPERIRVRLLPD